MTEKLWFNVYSSGFIDFVAHATHASAENSSRAIAKGGERTLYRIAIRRKE